MTEAAAAAASEALKALRWDWGDAYEIERDDGESWRARRRDGRGGWLTAASDSGLYGMIAADYAVRPVPRGTPPAHEAAPRELTAYSMEGPNTGQVANTANVYHFPAEALCTGCSVIIRAESLDSGWQHTGRKPGDPS